jgi:spore coat polysaccharide biosynthesis protein SpsF
MAVLAAKRAGRDGADVLVATSDDPDDDALANVVREHGVQCFRGPHEDVLARFVMATSDMGADDVCVRLTCDNIFPDSEFAARLAAAAATSATGYVGFSGGAEGLPYGLSGEAMSVKLLRQAAAGTADLHDREHVTPWIIRNCGRSPVRFPHVDGADLSDLRCTIDTMEDYRSIVEALAPLTEPVRASWQDLCRFLLQWHRARSIIPDQPRPRAH